VERHIYDRGKPVLDDLHPACHVSLTPPTRCPRFSYVHSLRGEGGTGVLLTKLCPFQPWVCVCGCGLCCGHPNQLNPHYNEGVCLPCVPDPTRTLPTTLLCLQTAGRGPGRGAASQHVPVPALGVWVGTLPRRP
jgi:hypothetical protein